MLTNWFTFLLYKFLKVRPTTVHDDHILSLSVSFKQRALVKSEVDLYRATSYKVYLFVFLSGTFIKCSWLLLFIRFISLTLLIKRFFLFLPHLFSLQQCRTHTVHHQSLPQAHMSFFSCFNVLFSQVSSQILSSHNFTVVAD